MHKFPLNNGRLGFFGIAADSDFWDGYHKINLRKYRSSLKGDLGQFAKPFLRYLPRRGKIIEAGCGSGKYVVALRALGFDCEGIDYGEKTVSAVKELFPDMPIAVGDVTRLPVPDGYYQGYISLGVMEHRLEGPDIFLKEAHRVLAPGGIAYISVPYFNMLRRLKAHLGCYDNMPENALFYQQAFTIHDMEEQLSKYGFRVVTIHGYASWKAIKDEITLFGMLNGIPKIGGLYRTIVGHFPCCDRFLGHMVGFVCKRL